ncbi:MAG TPA: site-2 protease family protein [Acetobacteraceae bacterium]|nr:site-2 protease family protein [Acetobacteraceae bacterium]
MSFATAEIVLAAIAAILAITLHEAAHGYAALALGDDTARRAGRLSLNPLRHVDPVGTLLLPGLLVLAHFVFHLPLILFGWAKPVPIGAAKFRDPRRGMMIIAAAGPAMNFLLAWLAAVVLTRAPPSPLEESFLLSFILVNLVLGLFNLIPIPPLDGGRIAVGLLPLPLARIWARMEGAGLVIVLLLLFVVPALLAELGVRFDPIRGALFSVLEPAFAAVMWLAGHPIGPGFGERYL